MRIVTILAGAVAAGLLLAAPAARAQNAGEIAAAHAKAVTLDSHTDLVLPDTSARYRDADGGSRTDIAKLKAGGVDAIVIAVEVDYGPATPEGVKAARAMADDKLARIRQIVADSKGQAEIALSPADVERLAKAGKVAIIIGYQNARAVGDDLSYIDTLYKAGVRVFAFTHSGDNAFADSSRPLDPPYHRNRGLSPLGRQALARLNDLGMVVDVSQLSPAATLQVVAASRAPVAATHSNARAIANNVRNLSDAEIDAIAAKGGVVQMTPFYSYLRNPPADWVARVNAVRKGYGLSPIADAGEQYRDGGSLPKEKGAAYIIDMRKVAFEPTSIADYINQLDYVAKRVGYEHVGIGTDFNQGGGVEGYNNESEAPHVTAELMKRGYTGEQVAAIWGGNFLRVWRAAESAAKK